MDYLGVFEGVIGRLLLLGTLAFSMYLSMHEKRKFPLGSRWFGVPLSVQ